MVSVVSHAWALHGRPLIAIVYVERSLEGDTLNGTAFTTPIIFSPHLCDSSWTPYSDGGAIPLAVPAATPPLAPCRCC